MPDFDDPNDEEKQLKLSAEDGATPYSAPDDVNTHGQLAKDAPQKDTDFDDSEAYSEGENAAAGLQTDEHPDEDDHAIRIA